MLVGDVQTEILKIVDAGNGRVLYRKVYDDLAYEARQYMRVALRALKSEGVAQCQNRVVERKPVFEVFRIVE